MVLWNAGRVLLMRRSTSMPFAPGMHVFPGGGVNDDDLRSLDPLRTCARRETLEEVAIDVSECVLFDRWITPELEERRYDVTFYLAWTSALGTLSTTEADDLLWIEPARAVEMHVAGELPMLRPTEMVLRELSHALPSEDVEVIGKLPRLRSDGTWDVIDVDSGTIVMNAVRGPTIAEVDGSVLP